MLLSRIEQKKMKEKFSETRLMFSTKADPKSHNKIREDVISGRTKSHRTSGQRKSIFYVHGIFPSDSRCDAGEPREEGRKIICNQQREIKMLMIYCNFHTKLHTAAIPFSR